MAGWSQPTINDSPSVSHRLEQCLTFINGFHLKKAWQLSMRVAIKSGDADHVLMDGGRLGVLQT